MMVPFAASTGAGVDARPALAAGTSFTWSIVPSPNPVGSAYNHLNAITAVSPSDAWAVGDQYTSEGETLIEHWNGSTWGIVPSPNTGTRDNYLYGVAAFGSRDVWAVGYRESGSEYAYQTSTVVQHWNGTAWSVVPSPNPSTNQLYGANYLTGIAALAPNNVWAVGYQWITTGYGALIEHWNGSAWSVVGSPPATYRVLTAVAAISATDIWAVGYSFDFTNGYQPLTEHWNGTAWSVVPVPNVTTEYNFLNAVTAVSSDDVWAVGNDGFNTNEQPLILHWNGSQWSVVSSPHLSSGYNTLNGITALGSSDVWAVGYDLPNINGDERTLTERWNGSAWSVVSSPNTPQAGNRLYAIAPDAAGGVWSVGFAYPNSLRQPLQTLVLHGR
jgi:hypothetical protein